MPDFGEGILVRGYSHWCGGCGAFDPANFDRPAYPWLVVARMWIDHPASHRMAGHSRLLAANLRKDWRAPSGHITDH